MLKSQLLANAIRFLSIDAIEKANSGHPGMPMGMADIAQVLWCDFLKHNPKNPHWPNRDRFILSNGHGAMLHYGLLYLSGYDLSLDDLKAFRQLHSKTPGHPEVHETPGIETTTGPLGQGLANAVGMALAEKILAAQFNRDSLNLIDHHTYVFLGDGCLMEGISHEACSLAGTWGLNKLIAFWDDNEISIDGKTHGWFTDDTPKRFEAYQWDVIKDIDGHNPEDIKCAIKQAHQNKRPTLICCKTTIGFGSPNKAGTSNSHGAPLGPEEVIATREKLNWPHGPFDIPEDIRQAWDASDKGRQLEDDWQSLFKTYQKQHPALADELQRRLMGELPTDFNQQVAALFEHFATLKDRVATRKASKQCIEALTPLLPELMGGSADLSDSNCTRTHLSKAISAQDASGNYIHYGVREFGMAAIMNGLALHGGFIPYGGTFLTFLDYARNAVRLSALMGIRSIYVFTHDSVGLGEDGPTHQPVEHAAILRATPNLHTWRPCDLIETLTAWQQALTHLHTPSCLLLSRQGLPAQKRASHTMENIKKGGYILFDPDSPKAIIIASGSEVELAMAVAQSMTQPEQGIRVVSMPCLELFLEQDADYQTSVLPSAIKKRMVIEAATAQPWYQLVGLDGKIISIDDFGKSAPAKQVFDDFGFNLDNISHELATLLKI